MMMMIMIMTTYKSNQIKIDLNEIRGNDSEMSKR